MAAARVRRTFRYPGDDVGDDHGREELDEQEQEQVIRDLKEWDQKSTELWKMLITGIIMLISGFYAALILRDPIRHAEAPSLPSLIGLLSSLGSACIVYGVPLAIQEHFPRLGAQWEPGAMPTFVKSYHPVAVDLIALILNAMLALLSLAHSDKQVSAPGLAAFAIALLARHTLRPINVVELERLKYNYKGA